MKLVEILAREWFEWPINHDGPLAQNAHGGIYIPGRFRVDGFDAGLCMSVKHADDWRIAIVTRAQWEAERARISEIDSNNEGPWIRNSNESVFLEVDASSGVYKQPYPKEKIVSSEDWRNECHKQYEQELWDKVAIQQLEHYRIAGKDASVSVIFAADDADAFMAERAKRLKK